MAFRQPLLSVAMLAAALSAAPASAATVTAAVSVSINKPLLLSRVSDLNFGTITIASSTLTSVVRISQAGVVTCPVGATCTGATAAATFNVQGSNKNTVLITVPPTILSNGSDSIAFTPDAPLSIYLPNSGVPGENFNVGGSVAITPTNAGGTYTGTVSVTADYQ